MKVHSILTEINSPFDGNTDMIYFLRGDKNALIDTGTSQSPENDIAPVLKKQGLTLADIDLVLNTHGHFDHSGGNAAVKKAGHASILIHSGDADFLENYQSRFETDVKPILQAIVSKDHLEKEIAKFLKMSMASITVDRKLNDNDIIDIGKGCELRVIHLPGHSPGSAGYYWEKEGIIFIGDALPGLNDDLGGLPIIGDLAAYQRSLERLRQLPIRYMFHAHDFRGISLPPSFMRKGEEVVQYIEDCLEIAKRLSEIVRRLAPFASGKPLLEIYDQVIGKLPEEMGFKPAAQVEGPQPFLNAQTVFFALRQAS